MQRVIDAFHTRLADNVDRSWGRVVAAGIAFYRSLPEAAARAAITRVFTAFGQDLGRDPPDTFIRMMHVLGEQRSAQGAAVGEILMGMHHGFEAVSVDFAGHFAADPDARIWWEHERARISYIGAAALADAYSAARERVVRVQADEILALSCRVFRVHRGVLLLPLVGALPEARMRPITATLLDAVAVDRARVVLLDVSAVPVLDAAAADALVRAAQAVRLLGAAPLLVGVGPEVARAMVAAGVAFADVETLADLESGLDRARVLLGR